MSGGERVLRQLGLSAIWSALPSAMFGLWWIPVIPLGVVMVFYALWAFGNCASGETTYKAAWLGSNVSVHGGGSPIWPSDPYLVFGRRFRERIAQRKRAQRILRIAQMERELGIAHSPYLSIYQVEERELTYA